MLNEPSGDRTNRYLCKCTENTKDHLKIITSAKTICSAMGTPLGQRRFNLKSVCQDGDQWSLMSIIDRFDLWEEDMISDVP